VLNVGRLAPVKGQALLIEAIAELQRRGVAAEAKIVGAGPEREALARKIEELGVDGVELTGAVGQDRVRELYGWADVFCLPSFREGLPFVAIEALAMELPVVVTRIMGVPELVEDGVNGLLVAPGRVDELADALERLARDEELRRSLGTAGRAKVQRDYELSRLAAELRSAFEAPASAPVSTNR
jgi:glycosyltransferase involved in cell wall biosynthesis